MNIVFSTDTMSRGGKERQLCLLFSGLPPEEFNKYIFTKKRNYTETDNYLDEYGIEKKSVLLFDNYREYKCLVEKYKPDIIFSWDGITSFYNLKLYRKYNFYFINGNIRHGLRLFKLSHFFRSIVLWMSPYVIANSAAGLKVNNLKPGERNFVLHNGINISDFRVFSAEEKYLMKKKLAQDINPDKTLFISVANFVPYKDYVTVLNALSEIKDKIDFHYFIIGDGPLRKRIEEHITNLGLGKNIKITGRIKDVRKYLSISDIFIHSSRGEGISNAILEAMMCGLPVVSSDVGGVKETVYSRSSFLFKYKDKNGLKKCLEKAVNSVGNDFLTDKDYLKHLNKFSSETMISDFLKIINKIANQKL